MNRNNKRTRNIKQKRNRNRKQQKIRNKNYKLTSKNRKRKTSNIKRKKGKTTKTTKKQRGGCGSKPRVNINYYPYNRNVMDTPVSTNLRLTNLKYKPQTGGGFLNSFISKLPFGTDINDTAFSVENNVLNAWKSWNGKPTKISSNPAVQPIDPIK